MKICAACHEDLPKASYSKKQWKLDKYQRRCKVCITNNREVQPPPSRNDNEPNIEKVVKSFEDILVDAAEKIISGEELFKQPDPPLEDCPICFLAMSPLGSGWRYHACCGKVVCSGCIYAVRKRDGNMKCPFCRTPAYNEKEANKSMEKRAKNKDVIAIYGIGSFYNRGINGYPKDYVKAFDHFARAAKLGYAEAYCSVGYAYNNSLGVEEDERKARHYYELAAIGGNINARYNLGNDEIDKGNMDLAVQHHMIAVRSGFTTSLERIKWLYTNGHATKEDYTKALRLYQSYLDEIKSAQRDEAAAADESNRYY